MLFDLDISGTLLSFVLKWRRNQNRHQWIALFEYVFTNYFHCLRDHNLLQRRALRERALIDLTNWRFFIECDFLQSSALTGRSLVEAGISISLRDFQCVTVFETLFLQCKDHCGKCLERNMTRYEEWLNSQCSIHCHCFAF